MGVAGAADETFFFSPFNLICVSVQDSVCGSPD